MSALLAKNHVYPSLSIWDWLFIGIEGRDLRIFSTLSIPLLPAVGTLFSLQPEPRSRVVTWKQSKAII